MSQDADENISVELDLDQGGSLYTLAEALTKEQKAGIIGFLTFFERLNTIVELNLVPINTFNELYGYRFFLITHNPNVLKHVLLNEHLKESWAAIFRLHKKWVKYRTIRKMRIPESEHLVELTNDPFYQAS